MDASHAFGAPWRSTSDLWQPVGPGLAHLQPPPQRLADFPAAVKELAFAVKEIQPPSSIRSKGNKPEDLRNKKKLIEICNIPAERRNLRQVQFMASQLGEFRRLKGVDSGCLRQAVSRMAGVSIPAKRQIITEGEEADAFYVVIAGSLGVYKNKGDSKTKIATAGPGSCIGEIGLISKCPRTVTVNTLTKSLLLKMKKDDFCSTIATSLAACIAIECRDLQQFPALACCGATELIELTCSFKPVRFRPRETLLVQGGGSNFDSHIYLIKSGTAAVFADPEFGSRNSRATASKTVGACSLVGIIISGGVAGDWHLQRDSLSAHVVALTMLDTYRIHRMDLLRRLRSPEAVRIFYKEGHLHGLSIQSRLGYPELPTMPHSAGAQPASLTIGMAASRRSFAADNLSEVVHASVRQQLGLESSSHVFGDGGSSEPTSGSSPEPSPTSHRSASPSPSTSDNSYRRLLPPLGQAVAGIRFTTDDTEVTQQTQRVKMTRKLQSMPSPLRARSFNLRHVKPQARFSLVPSGQLLSVSPVPAQMPQVQHESASNSDAKLPSETAAFNNFDGPGFASEASSCDYGQDSLQALSSRQSDVLEGQSGKTQLKQPLSRSLAKSVGAGLHLGSGGPSGKLLSKINYYD